MEELRKDNFKIENQDMCAQCGGICCKKRGCSYIVKDFTSFRFADLKSLLDEGNISIHTLQTLQFADGKFTRKQVLMLKARSINRGVVDLFSSGGQCKMWTAKGCAYSFEERPSLGAGLIPDLQNGCSKNLYPEDKVISEWLEHQDVLEKLVKVYTGKKSYKVYEEQFISECASVLAKQKLAILLAGEDISEFELNYGEEEVLGMMAKLSDTMPFEVKKAQALSLIQVDKFLVERYSKDYPLKLKLDEMQ